MNNIIRGAVLFPFIAFALLSIPEGRSFWFFQTVAPHISYYIVSFFLLLVFSIYIPRWKDRNLPHPVFPMGNIHIVISVILGSLFFYIFRYRNFVPPPSGLGDSLLLIEHMPVYSKIFGYLDSFDELLSLFLYSRAYLFFNQAWGAGPVFAYALISSILGGLYIGAVFLFLRGRKLTDILWGIALLIATPALQIYSGYPENYAPATLFLAILMMTGATFLESLPLTKKTVHPKFFLIIGAISASGAMMHIIVGATLPALIYLTYAGSKFQRKAFVINALYASLSAIVIVSVTWGIFLFVVDHPVTIKESYVASPPYYPYTRLISSRHLLDLLNLLLLAAPAFPLIALFRYVGKRIDLDVMSRNLQVKRPWKKGDEQVKKFTKLATYSIFLIIFFANPLLGYPADWDLHTFFQFPLNLFLFYSLRNPVLRNDRRYNRILLYAATILLTFGTTGHWLLRNASWLKWRDSEIESVNRIEKRVNRAVTELESDPLILSKTPSDLKKVYVKAYLFQMRMKDAMEHLDNSIKEPLTDKLDNEIDQLRDLLMLQEEKINEERIREIWKNLIHINTRVSELVTKSPSPDSE